MEIKSAIFCTLDKETDLILKELFDLLPLEIKEFHKHISYAEAEGNLHAEMDSAIKSIKSFKKNEYHTTRHSSTGKFNCDFIILARIYEEKKIKEVSQLFKELFSSGEDDNVGEYDEIFFNFSNEKVIYRGNYFSITNHDSHGTLISDEALFEKIKYYFLFFLTTDLWYSENIHHTNRSFYFAPNPTEKYFKTIALDYDGLPIFTLRDLYHELLKERFIRELLEVKEEMNPEFSINKVKLISSLAVEELKTPEKPASPLLLSFWSTRSERKVKLEHSIKSAEISFSNYDSNCHSEAKKQRIELEKDVNTKLPTQITNAVLEIISSSKSISKLRLLLKKLLEKNGGLSGLMEEKEKEIFWPELFRFSSIKLLSNHPNWPILLILSGIFILPEIIDYLAYFPTETMIRWNIFTGLILAGYVIFSIFNIRGINKKFNEYYKTLLQNIENYYKGAFKSFVKYLEIHILKIFIKKLESTDETLMKNQALLSGIYLSSYQKNENYNNVRTVIENEMKNNSSFAEELKSLLLNNFINENITQKEIDNISQMKDPYESCLTLIKLLETDSETSRLVNLTTQINSIKNGTEVIKIVCKEVQKANLNIDSGRFLKLIEQEQLDEIISDFIKNQNYDILLSVLKSEFDYSSQDSVNRLLSKKHSTYYLSKSQDKIDTKEMLFAPENINNPDNITFYFTSLKVICGYLKIVDLKLFEKMEQ